MFDHVLSASREDVWEAILDPAVLSRILPGVEAFEKTAPDEYTSTLKLGIGAIKGTYAGTVNITDKRYPSSYVLAVQGKGVQGWVRGKAFVEFAEEGAGTRVSADADVQVGGRLAGIGQRMIEGVGKMMAKEFFVSLDHELQGRKEEGVGVATFFWRAVVRWICGLVSRRSG